MSNDFFMHQFFSIHYYVPRYSCENSFPLPMQLCLYQADHFYNSHYKAHFYKSRKPGAKHFKKKRESENHPYIKQHGGHESLHSQRRRVVPKMLILSVFTMHPAMKAKLASCRKEWSRAVQRYLLRASNIATHHH